MAYSPIMLVGGKALPTGVLGRSIPIDNRLFLTMTTTTSNQEVTLALSLTVGTVIDWGDGETTTATSETLIEYTHTYVTAQRTANHYLSRHDIGCRDKKE